ncbi:hypothetical protein Hanom_Chr11g00998471 [Helianthus anomalus]
MFLGPTHLPPVSHTIFPTNQTKLIILYYLLSKLLFWYMWFCHFYHFSPKLKLFASGSLWFQFYCHFGPKIKSDHICLIESCYFVLFGRGKMIISFL